MYLLVFILKCCINTTILCLKKASKIVILHLKMLFKISYEYDKFLQVLTILLISLSLISCGGFKKVDQRQQPDGSKAKMRKNVEEGRGVTIGGALKREVQLTNLALLILCGGLH